MDKRKVEAEIEELVAHLFEAINLRQIDYLLEANAKISQYLSDKHYNRIFTFIGKLLTPSEKQWLSNNINLDT